MNDEFNILLDQMRSDFIAEFPERCDVLDELVLAFEKDREGAFDALYRAVHSLKGSAGMFGLSLVTSICHQFESFLSSSDLKADMSLSVSFALSYVDLMKRVALSIGKESAYVNDIEHDLEQLRISSMLGRISILLIEPSVSRRKLCQGVLASMRTRITTQERAIPALEQMLHEPFDLLIAARELSDLNTIALVSALRESTSRNKNIPVIMVSSNDKAAPEHLNITVLKRDAQFIPNLAEVTVELLKNK